MTCEPCERAEADPMTGYQSASCLNCQARAIAQGPQAHAREADPSALQEVMRRIWPDREQYARGRSLVWAWIQRLEKA
jgi:hypothetical protein